MELVAGVDLGTSYCKILVADRSGTVRGLSRTPMSAEEPEPGHRVVPTDAFRDMIRRGLVTALEAAGADSAALRGISYASQANTFLLLDADEAPLTPLVVWTDRRVEQYPSRIASLLKRDDFLSTTGLGVGSTGLCIAKLGWYKEERPEIWGRAAKLLTISDYLTWWLTGVYAGDRATTSLLGLWDQRSETWWETALEAAELRHAMLPQPHLPGTVVGAARGAAAKELALPPQARVAVGSLDHHAAALGAGIGELAPASESTGTVVAALVLAGAFEPKANASVGPHFHPGTYYTLAFANHGAGALEWYRDTFAQELSIRHLMEHAATVPPGSEGLLCLPHPSEYAGLEGFAGRRPEMGHGHYFRAILESIAAGLYGLLLHAGAGTLPDRVVATGGGAQSDLWLQLKADMTGATFVRAAVEEPAAFGAAIMAAHAAGWYASIDEAANAWKSPGRAFVPDPVRHATYKAWHEKLRSEESRM